MIVLNKQPSTRTVKLFKNLFLFLLIFIFRNIQKTLLVEASMSESRELMSGKILRVAILHFPPVLIVEKQPDGTIFATKGTVFEIIDYIAKALNIKYEFVLLSNEDLKKYGLGLAMINMLKSGIVDFAPLGLIPSPERNVQVDFSFPTAMEPFRLVVPYPKEESRLLAIVRPFHSSVWLCLGVTLIVLVSLLTFLSILYHRYTQERREIESLLYHFDHHLLDNFAFLLSHLTNQGYRYHLRLRSRGTWLLVGIWCLTCVVLANAYAGTLFSFLSVAKLEPIVNSLEELANTKHLKLLVLDRGELANRFLNSTSGTGKLIGDTLRAHPEGLFSNLTDAKSKLMTGEYAFAYLDVFNYGIIDAIYRESGNKCRLTFAKEPLPIFLPTSAGLTKTGPYTKAINEQIQAQFEVGLIRFNAKIVMPRIDQCKMENKRRSSQQKKLSLVDMSSAFVVLGLGLSLGFLVFLIELIFKQIKQHHSIYFVTR